jgi:hypothetical protein
VVQETQHKSFSQPDQRREFRNGEAQIVSIREAVVVVDWYGASNYAKSS